MQEHSAAADEQSLDTVIAQYLQAVDSGEMPDREAFLGNHPVHAQGLREFFADQDLLVGAVAAIGGDFAVDSVTARTPNDSPNYPRPFGPYQLLEEIARGGMGVVYKARQAGLERVVALKMILAGQFASAEDVKRFQVEARNAAHLDHPNIVPVYEVGRHHGQHYFTMKLIEGGSLCGQGPRFAAKPAGAAELVASVASAVHYAHQHGILHRDLKPGNILLDREGRPQVTDFGLARGLDDDHWPTLAGNMVGSPRYMAPEQACGEPLTVAADVWGLGAILYELLTDRPPFDGPTTLAVLEKVRSADPPSPSAVNRLVDRDLDVVCAKCLEKDPARRYVSAESLAQDLRRWLRGEPVIARPVGPVERAVRWVRRNRAAAAAVASGLIALGLALTVAVGTVYQTRLHRAYSREVQARTGESVQRALAESAAREARRQTALAERALGESDVYAYIARIAWAEKEYLANDVARAEQILDDCPPAQRKWEWAYLKRLCHSERAVLPTTRPIRELEVDAGSGSFTSVSVDGSVQFWSKDGAPAGEPLRPQPQANAVAISRSGGRMILQSSNEIDLWLRGREQWLPDRTLRKIVNYDHCCTPAFSSDGKSVAAAVGRDVFVWDVESGNLRWKLSGHTTRVNAMAFDSDSSRLVSCSGRLAYTTEQEKRIEADQGELVIWDLNAGTAVNTFGSGCGGVMGLCMVGSHRIVSAHGDGTLKLWTPSGNLSGTLRGHADAVLCVCASPDESHVVSGGADKTVRVWDVTGAEQRFVYRGHTAPVHSVAYLAGDRVASAADDSVKIWDAAAGPEARIIPRSAGRGATDDVAISPDGTLLAAGIVRGKGRLEVWRLPEGRLAWAHSSFPGRIAFARRGNDLLLGKGNAISAADSGELRKSLDGEVDPYVASALTADGNWAATAPINSNGAVEVWDFPRRKLVRRVDLGVRSVFDVSFSQDGSIIACAGGDFRGGLAADRSFSKLPGTVTLLDTADGSRRASLVNGTRFPCWCVALSPDKRFVAAGGGAYFGISPNSDVGPPGEVRVWEVATGREVFYAPRGDCVFRVCFSPDGTRLVSGGGRLGARTACDLTLTDTAVWKDVLRLSGHHAAIHGIGFSGDGRLLASADEAGEVRIWNTPPITAGVWTPPVQPPAQDHHVPAFPATAVPHSGHVPEILPVRS